MENIETYSPMMQHYLKTKQEYKDSLLFYRLGDFYEMFFDDAITASKELEITLTGRECGKKERAPMCGVPFHSAENYISKLIKKGYKVAICEQLEDAKSATGMVKRDVVRIVTPGTLIESNLLDETKNNYIMCILKQGIFFGISICDISTGNFYATQIKETNNFILVLEEIARYMPAEIIANSLLLGTVEEIKPIQERFEVYVNKLDDKYFIEKDDNLFNKYIIVNNIGEQIKSDNEFDLAIASINALLKYLKETQKMNLSNINKIEIYNTTKYMSLDINTRKNLEILQKMRDGGKKGSLLWVLDKTSTSMGGRLLRMWLSNPLKDVVEINKRLDAVKELKENFILRDELSQLLKKVYDIERLSGKICYGNANGRDMIALKNSINQLPKIKQALKNTKCIFLQNLYNELDELKDIYEIIEKSIIEEPPISIKEGGIIKEGYNEEVDKLKIASREGKNWLVQLEVEEKEKTGIKNIKIGFNKVFGYYIEVTKSYLNQVPDRFIRKQTLANCERYITEELKELENTILGAEEKIISLEYDLFLEIREKISIQIQRMQNSASVISILDVINSFAQVSYEQNYTKPIVDNGSQLEIKEGRHPVIEKSLSSGEFIENDTYLDENENRIAIITGPNMAGKSTYMRQVALITLMAQIGSEVPASYAKIGVVDKIFTRVGASDDLSTGQSTFMVEMTEVATILKQATKKSLIILDEIGRGTSTYDGLSIAWAVTEYISNEKKCGAKTLFATHYHELTELENKIEGIKNYRVEVKEKGEDVIFLRKIVPGGTDESYGIHVAKLAGVPQVVVKRANEILKNLERKSLISSTQKTNKSVVEGQLNMYNFKLADVAHEIDKINVEELTPVEALNVLAKIKEKLV